MSLFGLPWWFWVLLVLVVVVYRLTVRRGLASLKRLRPERRELTERERRAVEMSPFRDEFGRGKSGKEKDGGDQSSQQS